MITKQYSHIYEFIIRHFPCEDFITRWLNDDIPFDGQWDRVDIAIELKGVIYEILTKISNIDSNLVLHSLESNIKQSQQITFPEFEDNRLSMIFLKLLNARYVELSSDRRKYRWIGDNGLYGYFIDIVTEYLKIRKDSGRIPWKYFEGIIENHKSILTTAQDRVSKYNGSLLPKPDGFKDINDIIITS